MANFEYAAIGRAQVVRLKGDFWLPEHCVALTEALARYLEMKSPCVVVNWAEMSLLNGRGFTALFTSEMRIIENGGAVRNCCLTKVHVGLVNMIKPPILFLRLFETEQEATDSCANPEPILGR